MEKFHHILGSWQFSKKNLEKIFDEAEKIKNGNFKKSLNDKSFDLLFYEPSSRTFGSFFEAIERLGGRALPIQNVSQFSSAAKGETLKDTIRTFSKYANGIILRHDKEGSAQKAAKLLDEFAPKIPLINAGDGKGEHPTQMLLDLFTIWEKKKEKLKFGKLKIAFVGDLENSRVFHSDLLALSLYGAEFFLISEKGNNIPGKIKKILKQKKIKFRKEESLENCAKKIDILMLTRLQKERLKNKDSKKIQANYNEKFSLTPKLQKLIRKDCIVMHPLPRTGEIPESFDCDPRAIYFKDQIENGLYVRMALLKMIFSS